MCVPVCGRYLEQNPNKLLQSLNECIGEVMKRQEKARVKAVGITNQRETTFVWDRDTGDPLHNAICEKGSGNVYVHLYNVCVIFCMQCGVIVVLE